MKRQRTSVGLDVDAGSVVACVLDGETREIAPSAPPKAPNGARPETNGLALYLWPTTPGIRVHLAGLARAGEPGA